MKTRVKWVQDRTFLGETGSGHTVVMDGPPEHGWARADEPGEKLNALFS